MNRLRIEKFIILQMTRFSSYANIYFLPHYILSPLLLHMDSIYPRLELVKKSYSTLKLKKITEEIHRASPQDSSLWLFAESEVMNTAQPAEDDSVIIELASLLNRPALSPQPFSRSAKYRNTYSPTLPSRSPFADLAQSHKFLRISKLQPSRSSGISKLNSQYGIRRDQRHLTAGSSLGCEFPELRNFARN